MFWIAAGECFMMPVKLTGCILVITTAALMGIQKGEAVKNSYRQMQYLQRILCMIESEIRYAHSYLGELFGNTAQSVKEPYRGWLLFMKREMEEEDSRSLSDIWERGVSGYLKHSGLPEKELHRLSRLGGQLGAPDLKLQLRVLELYQEQLGLEIHEIREEMQVKVRLCHCLGIMGGMLIAVLLI